MKLTSLLETETQSRKDLLLWQQKLMDVFPDAYEIGLATRQPYGNEPFNVVTVERNGKELFYFDTRRASIDFFSTMRVCGELIRELHLGVKDLQKNINDLMLMYELQRKIGNLLSDTKCIIDKDRKKQDTLVVEIQSKSKLNGQAVMVMYNTKTQVFTVATDGGFSVKKTFGTTKDMTKAIDLVEKGFKHITDK